MPSRSISAEHQRALIDTQTGALTVSVADSQGAYVAFGQCKVAQTKTQ